MTQLARTLALLDRLVGFPTLSCDSNLDLIDWVQTLLVDGGFDVTRIPSPDGTKAGLFARIGPPVDGGICLSAHTDVVATKGQPWTRPPFALSDEGPRVFGRGTTDMKGFLACALALAERIGDTPLTAPLCLSISYDEEIGCVGMQQMMPVLKTLIGTPRAVIVGEPTSMQVATGHKGKTALRIACHGQAGHSALAPNFVNAIHVAADFVQQIRALQGRLTQGPRDDGYAIPYGTLHIGTIEGGSALNIVPAEARLSMEFRHLADTPADEILQQINAVAAQVSSGFPAIKPIFVEVTNAYPGLSIAPTHATVAWASKMADTRQTTKVAFGTEAGFFAALGLNTVVVGPGDMARDGHKPDEGLDKTELVACNAMMDAIAADLKR